MSKLLISILWLLPVIAILISSLAGLFLWLSLRLYRLKKYKTYTKGQKLRRDLQ